MAIKLPNADEISNTLSALLRREVFARPAKAAPAASLITGGLYHDGTGKLLGAVITDLAFAAHAGACFSLIPPDVAEECIAAKTLDESMRENFAEVLNVGSRLFNTSGRVALKSTFFPPAAPPTEANGATAATFDITIEGYGSGLLGLRAL